MAEFTINGKKAKGSMSALTFVIYELEFGTDLIQDLFGKVKADDLVEDEGVAFDFTQVDWAKLPKAVWAMLKTEKESTPSFKKWAGNCKQMNLFEWNAIVGEAIDDTFFHTAATEREGA